jgi:hypothetical protein
LASYSELVTADPRDQVAIADDRADPPRELDQHTVSGRMPQAVVDRLEIVQIEEEQRSRRAGLDVAQTVDEQGAVRERCEGVAPREPAEILLGFAAPRDIEHVALGVHRLTRLGVHRRLVAYPDGSAVLREQAVLGDERLTGLVRAMHLREHPLAVVRMEHIDEQIRVRDPLLDRVTEQCLHLRARVDVAAVLAQVVDVDHERQLLDQPLVMSLELAAPALGLVE